jgi:hypothetical protein
MFSGEHRCTGGIGPHISFQRRITMSFTLRLLAAGALLGALSGCAGFVPNWTANPSDDSMHSPAIYEPSPSD